MRKIRKQSLSCPLSDNFNMHDKEPETGTGSIYILVLTVPVPVRFSVINLIPTSYH